ncbi:hypothetical protein HY256_07025 [Candidatus Sumerlaeota bacterium]|nr:hypothetical protein [Candidatus Sumerlaeota bacterium]
MGAGNPEDLEISIVYAIPCGFNSAVLEKCRESLMREVETFPAEIMLVEFVPEQDAIRCAKIFPSREEQVVTANGRPILVPHLWGVGIQEAKGRIVALSSAGLVPTAGWLSFHLSAHEESRIAGVGGVFRVSPDLPLTQRAIGWSRYSAYLDGGGEREVSDFAADNGSYKRAPLSGCHDAMREGFWEPEIHARMRTAGGHLIVSSKPVMEWVGGYRFGAFLAQRFNHGTKYGQSRSGKSPAWKIVFLALCWILPLLLTARCWRRMGRARVSLIERIAVLPALVVIFGAWSLGEIRGAIFFNRLDP